MPPRSKAGFTPATVIDHLDDPIATLQGAWTPEDEHSSATVDDAAHRRCARRATAPPSGCCSRSASPRTVQYAKTMGVGDVPSVPSLALGSGEVTLQSMTAAYAAFANHGLVPHADADSPRRGSATAACCTSRRTSSTRAISDTTAFLMSTMMADVINAGTGNRARAARVHAAGRGQDRHDQRLQRRLVHRLHAEAGDRRLGRVRSAAHDSAERLRRRRRGAGVGEVHEGGDEQRQARMAAGAGRHHDRARLPAVRHCCRPKAARTSKSSTTPARIERRSMVYTEYFARGTEPTAYCDLHPTRGIMTKLAGVFGGDDERRRRRTSKTPASRRPAATATSATRIEHAGVPPAAPPQEETRLLVAVLRAASKDERRRSRQDRSRRGRRAASAVIRIVPSRHALSGHCRPSPADRAARRDRSRAGRCRRACCSPVRPASASASPRWRVAQALNCLKPRRRPHASD